MSPTYAKQARALALVVVSLFLSFYLLAFQRVVGQFYASGEATLYLNDPYFVPQFIALAGVIALALAAAFSPPLKRAWGFLFAHRVHIGVALIALATLFELSGSSVNSWALNFGGDASQGTLFGIPRTIRSDEWQVSTPFAISQEYAGYSPTTDILRATSTDVTLLYAQPCWSFSTLFRPFLWGYLLLGSAKGLAFFWSARLVVLFLVSLQMGLLLTDKAKDASVAYAVMVSFSPVVQWWFAVNGIAELFIFGQGLVLVFRKALHARRLQELLTCSVAMGWLASSFVFVLYPAWQVPFFWIFLALGAATFSQALRGAQKPAVIKNLCISVSVMLLAVGVSFLVALLPVLDVYKTVSNTIYPGRRFFNGGGCLQHFPLFALSIFGSINENGMHGNAPESAAFYALCPLGFIVGIVVCIAAHKRKRPIDPVIAALLPVEAVILVYLVFELPPFFTRITLLAHSTDIRCLQIIGYVDLVILLRAACVYRAKHYSKPSRHRAFASSLMARPSIAAIASTGLSLLYVGALFYLGNSSNELYTRLLFALGMVVAAAIFIFSFIAAQAQRNNAPLLLASLIVLASGATVNPLQMGIAAVTENDLAQSIQQSVSTNQSATWATESSLLGQLCISSGAKTINSINTYPALSRWQSIDPSKDARYIYNRYAFIDIKVSAQTSFKLENSDHFAVTLTLDQLAELGTTYYISSDADLARFNTATATAELYTSVGNWHIYKIKRPQEATEGAAGAGSQQDTPQLSLEKALSANTPLSER